MQEKPTLEAIRNGENEALRMLFSKNARALYQSAYNRLHDENKARAALREAFRRAQRDCENCPDDAEAWLHRLLAECCVPAVHREAAPSFEEAAPQAEKKAPVFTLSEETLRAREEARRLREASAQPVREAVTEAATQAEAAPVPEPDEPIAKAPVKEAEPVAEGKAEVEERGYVPETPAISDEVPSDPHARSTGAVRRVQKPAKKADSEPEKKYDIHQDAWLMELREKRRREQGAPSGGPTAVWTRAAAPKAQPAPAPIPEAEKAAAPAAENPPRFEEFGEEEEELSRVSPWSVILLVFLALVVLALAWCLVGLLMNLKILPWVDLGYSWFNTHITDLF